MVGLFAAKNEQGSQRQEPSMGADIVLPKEPLFYNHEPLCSLLGGFLWPHPSVCSQPQVYFEIQKLKAKSCVGARVAGWAAVLWEGSGLMEHKPQQAKHLFWLAWVPGKLRPLEGLLTWGWAGSLCAHPRGCWGQAWTRQSPLVRTLCLTGLPAWVRFSGLHRQMGLGPLWELAQLWVPPEFPGPLHPLHSSGASVPQRDMTYFPIFSKKRLHCSQWSNPKSIAGTSKSCSRPLTSLSPTSPKTTSWLKSFAWVPTPSNPVSLCPQTLLFTQPATGSSCSALGEKSFWVASLIHPVHIAHPHGYSACLSFQRLPEPSLRATTNHGFWVCLWACLEMGSAGMWLEHF